MAAVPESRRVCQWPPSRDDAVASSASVRGMPPCPRTKPIMGCVTMASQSVDNGQPWAIPMRL
eukprot:10348314-Alexandrium_andersonii.AAC.1